jgi:hypothetical protein
VGTFAAARAKETGQIESRTIPTLAWLQKEISVTNSAAGESFASLKTAVADLGEFSARIASSKAPPTPELFGEAAAVLASVEKRQDEFYDRLVVVIRGWGIAHVAMMSSGEMPGGAARGREMLATFSRVCNARNRFKADVRQWRTGGGQESVIGFFRMIDETFPEKI